MPRGLAVVAEEGEEEGEVSEMMNEEIEALRIALDELGFERIDARDPLAPIGVKHFADGDLEVTIHFDREPQPSDGPDYHADHAAWLHAKSRAAVERKATCPDCGGEPHFHFCGGEDRSK